MTVWTVSVWNESGDRFPSLTFAKKPTQAKLKMLLANYGDEPDQDGPGAFGSFTYFGQPVLTEVM